MKEYIVFWLLGSLAISCILGFVTSVISESKGYNKGFWWGFFLNIIGVIIAACRPYNIHHESDRWKCSNCGRINLNDVTTCVCGNPKGYVSPPEPKQNPADELLKYKQLLDAGAITQEEFDTKKKQLLKL